MSADNPTRPPTRLAPRSVVLILARLARVYTLHSPFSVGKRTVISGRSVFHLFDRHRLEARVGTLVGTRSWIRFPDMIQKTIFFCGVWEPAISAFMRHTLRAGDTFVDVGANVGYHSCLAAHQVGPLGRVHAIEASPQICQILEKNVALNRADNVRIYNVAVMDTVGAVQVFLGPESSLGITTVTPDAAPDARRVESVEVPAMPLHHVVDPEVLHAARLIKVDVEGAEWLVLRGIAQHLGQFDDSTEWLFEITPESVRRLGGTAREMVALFARAGWRAYWLENRYDIDWYVRRARAILDDDLATLVRPLPADFESMSQIDVLFSRQSYQTRR